MDFKFLTFSFLIWNVFKLFQIKADPIIQMLNVLLFIGIYFEIEDKDFNFKSKGINLFIGILLFTIVIVRSFLLSTTSDKFYYLLLPSGIFSISLITNNFWKIKYFNNIILISLLLPLRRLFFYIFNPILLFFTKYLTLFTLMCLGLDPILIDRSIFLGDSELVISEGCGGADNMFFAISAVIIFKIIFSLKKRFNLVFIYFITFFIPLIVNVLRNSLLAFIITLNAKYRDQMFIFFHESYGSLLFSFISLFLISYIYLQFLNKELEAN